MQNTKDKHTKLQKILIKKNIKHFLQEEQQVHIHYVSTHRPTRSLLHVCASLLLILISHVHKH